MQETTSVIRLVLEGLPRYLREDGHIFLWAGIFSVALVLAVLALVFSSPGGRTTRSSAGTWVLLAALFCLGPMSLGFFHYLRAWLDFRKARQVVGGGIPPSLEAAARAEFVAPLLVAGVMFIIVGVVFLLALSKYVKLPATPSPAVPGQAPQASAAPRPPSRAPLASGIAAFVLILAGIGGLAGFQCFKAQKLMNEDAGRRRAPSVFEDTAYGPAQETGKTEVEQPPEVDLGAGVESGIEGGFETSAADERPVRAVTAPKLLKQVPPQYPEVALAARVEGIVILEAVIDKGGKVKEVKVLRSIPLLDPAAMEAVKQWEYAPFLVNGEPKEVLFTVTVRFSLLGTDGRGDLP